MKTNAIVRIVLFSIAILVLGSILIGGILLYTFSANADWGSISEFTVSFLGTNDGTVASTGEIAATDVRNVKIAWVSGNITIRKADVPNITFQETPGLNDSQKMVWKLQGNTLVIHSSRYRVNVGAVKDKDLTVTVPMDYDLEKLEIETVSANLTADSLHARAVSVEAVDGTCDFIGNTVLNELSIETVDGDVTFSGTLQDLECEGVAADIRCFFANVPSSIEMSTVDGNIRLTLPSDAGFAAEMDTVSGSFHSDFSTTTSGKRYICGDGKCAIEISGISGDLTILKAK